MRTLTYRYVKFRIESFGYKLLSNNYVNGHTPLKVECPKGHIFHPAFQNFKNAKHKCRQCFEDNRRHSYEYVKFYIESQNHKLLSEEYINNNTSLKVECSKGHIFFPTFHNFKDSHTRCLTCFQEQKYSKGVKLILEYFDRHNINFKTEYKFDNCRDINPLPFDFAILENETLLGLIEFQGIQHYTDTGWGSCSDIQYRDKIKNDYCKRNNINFIAIPYNQNITTIIHQFIKQIT